MAACRAWSSWATLCFHAPGRISGSGLALKARGKVSPFGERLRHSRALSSSRGTTTVELKPQTEERIVGELGGNGALSATANALDVDDMVDLKTLFENRVHLGHKHGCWNPVLKPYIYGRLHDVHIFDLDTSLTLLRLALKVAGLVAYQGGIILFVNERTQFDRLVQQTARKSKEYFFSPSWYPGILTNSFMLLKTMKLPDLVIFLSVRASQNAVREVAMSNIPSIGIIDSDCDPALITYPIPGNDDSPASVQLYCKLFHKVICKAKQLKESATVPEEPAATKRTPKTASLSGRNITA